MDPFSKPRNRRTNQGYSRVGAPEYEGVPNADGSLMEYSKAPYSRGAISTLIGMTALIGAIAVTGLIIASILAGSNFIKQGSSPMFDNIQVSGNVDVHGNLNYSIATVTSAPEYIIVGTKVNDTADFPLGGYLQQLRGNARKRFLEYDVNSEAHLRMPAAKRAHVENNLKKFNGKRIEVADLSDNHKKRSTVDLFPVFPSLIEVPGPFPPANAHEVATIQDAMKLLQGKVITNTTILLRSGTYNENFVVDGFDSNCGTVGSNDVNDALSVLSCRGVTIVGDNRRVAGYTWTKGALSFGSVSELGNSDSVFGDDIVCDTPTSVRITTPGLDLTALGIVAGDKITIYDFDAATFTEKTITSVDADTFHFAEIGCTIGAEGSSVTFMPNRIIQGQAELANQPAYSPTPDLEDLAKRTSAALSVHKDSIVFGLWVRDPEGSAHTRMTATCIFSQASVFLSGIVCDGQRGTAYRQFPQAFTFGQAALFFDARSYSTNKQASRAGLAGSDILTGENVTNPDFSSLTTFGTGDGFSSCTFAGEGTEFNIFALTVLNGMGSFSAHTELLIGTLNVCSLNEFTLVSAVLGKLDTEFAAFFGGQSRAIRAWQGGRFSNSIILRITSPAPRCIDATNDSQFGIYSAFGMYFEDCQTAIEISSGGDVYLNAYPYYDGPGDAYTLTDGGDLVMGDNAIKSAQPVEDDVSFNPLQTVNYLEGAGARAINITSVELAQMINKEFTIISKSAELHTVMLDAGTYWQGTDTVAAFPATIGAGIKFHVVSITEVVLTGNFKSVTFSP
jgi:hypothetical protein